MSIFMGVDIGQKHEASGLCVTEAKEREEETGYHFMVRYLDRLPAGASYPDIAEWVDGVAESVRERTKSTPCIMINTTGLGEPVYSLFRKTIRRGGLIAVTLNYGDKRVRESGEMRLGKSFLVSRLQTLLQTGRLHLPKIDSMQSLVQELLDYQLNVEETDSERVGAFPVGSRDELVTALGLTVQEAPLGPILSGPMKRRTIFPGTPKTGPLRLFS